jgi:hypothetical protein
MAYRVSSPVPDLPKVLLSNAVKINTPLGIIMRESRCTTFVSPPDTFQARDPKLGKTSDGRERERAIEQPGFSLGRSTPQALPGSKDRNYLSSSEVHSAATQATTM